MLCDQRAALRAERVLTAVGTGGRPCGGALSATIQVSVTRTFFGVHIPETKWESATVVPKGAVNFAFNSQFAESSCD